MFAYDVCASDVSGLCPSQPGPDFMACLKQHEDSLSEACLAHVTASPYFACHDDFIAFCGSLDSPIECLYPYIGQLSPSCSSFFPFGTTVTTTFPSFPGHDGGHPGHDGGQGGSYGDRYNFGGIYELMMSPFALFMLASLACCCCAAVRRCRRSRRQAARQAVVANGAQYQPIVVVASNMPPQGVAMTQMPIQYAQPVQAVSQRIEVRAPQFVPIAQPAPVQKFNSQLQPVQASERPLNSGYIYPSLQ